MSKLIETKRVAKTSQVTKTVTEKSKSVALYKVTDIHALDTISAQKMINQIKITGTKLRKLAHQAACGILLHWQEHGDWTKLRSLRDAIEGSMSKAMARGFDDFVSEFSSLEWSKGDKNTPAGYKNMAVNGERIFWLLPNPQAQAGSLQANGALNEPFYSDRLGDRPPYSFDFNTALAEFMKKAQFALDRKAKSDAEKAKLIHINASDIKALENLKKRVA